MMNSNGEWRVLVTDIAWPSVEPEAGVLARIGGDLVKTLRPKPHRIVFESGEGILRPGIGSIPHNSRAQLSSKHLCCRKARPPVFPRDGPELTEQDFHMEEFWSLIEPREHSGLPSAGWPRQL